MWMMFSVKTLNIYQGCFTGAFNWGNEMLKTRNETPG